MFKIGWRLVLVVLAVVASACATISEQERLTAEEHLEKTYEVKVSYLAHNDFSSSFYLEYETEAGEHCSAEADGSVEAPAIDPKSVHCIDKHGLPVESK